MLEVAHAMGQCSFINGTGSLEWHKQAMQIETNLWLTVKVFFVHKQDNEVSKAIGDADRNAYCSVMPPPANNLSCT